MNKKLTFNGVLILYKELIESDIYIIVNIYFNHHCTYTF